MLSGWDFERVGVEFLPPRKSVLRTFPFSSHCSFDKLLEGYFIQGSFL